MSDKPEDKFWIAVGKGLVICITEAFASAAGGHLADRLLAKDDPEPGKEHTNHKCESATCTDKP